MYEEFSQTLMASVIFWHISFERDTGHGCTYSQSGGGWPIREWIKVIWSNGHPGIVGNFVRNEVTAKLAPIHGHIAHT